MKYAFKNDFIHSILLQFCSKNEKNSAAYIFYSLQTSNKLIIVVYQVIGLAIVEVCKDANLLAWNFIGGQIPSPHRIIVRKYFECKRSIVFRKLILHKRGKVTQGHNLRKQN